jgi:hypothetical protein
MKFCPVVPEICRGKVHGARKERKKNNNNNNKKRSKNNKSPKLCLGDLIIIIIIYFIYFSENCRKQSNKSKGFTVSILDVFCKGKMYRDLV